jgi:hypothetical protein
MSLAKIRRMPLAGSTSIGVAFAEVVARAGWPERLIEPRGSAA